MTNFSVDLDVGLTWLFKKFNMCDPTSISAVFVVIVFVYILNDLKGGETEQATMAVTLKRTMKYNQAAVLTFQSV